MNQSISKRGFLTAAMAAIPLAAQTAPATKMPDRGPAIDGGLVKDFVAAAHGNLEKTQAMLVEKPGLLNATWDWGGGDFETALGGASHMGRKDIAMFLLDKGARMDVFAAAMLGKLEIVKAAALAFPGIQNVLGPHKIPLIAHAKRGGADEVVKFLEGIKA